MSKLEQQENIGNIQQIRWDYTELINLYNRLDSEQRVEFKHKLESLIKQPVLTQQIKEHLTNLSEENYERMFVYTQLLLMS
jgi:hypothetical protein